MDDRRADPRLAVPPRMPRLLAFYQETVDIAAGFVSGWQPVAWGLQMDDGTTVTVAVDHPVRATLWHSVADATEGLDAFVDTPEPRPPTIADRSGDGRVE
jgi:hypothetical protein